MASTVDDDLDHAVSLLRAGRLVAFPTETVYGLGADASNDEAVKKIFAVKGRPADHPVIVHLPDAAQLEHWASAVPERAQRLASRFWPGPLTLVLPRAASVHDVVTGGQDTVGLRVPSHPLALELLRRFGRGLAAPSANKFGRLSPTTAEHVRSELGESVDLILDGGACPVGIESTIVDLSGDEPALLRPGRISKQELERTLGIELRIGRSGSPRTPGMLPIHYAPKTPVRIVPTKIIEAESHRTVAVLARRPRPESISGTRWIQAPSDAAAYARELYGNLRALDQTDAEVILVEALPEGPDWVAVRDRLTRAASA